MEINNPPTTSTTTPTTNPPSDKVTLLAVVQLLRKYNLKVNIFINHLKLRL